MLAKFATELLRVVLKGEGLDLVNGLIDEEGDGFEAASMRFRTSPKPSRDAHAIDSIGLALTYSFQSTKRFASP